MGGEASCERCVSAERMQARELLGIVLLVMAIGCYAGGVLMWVLLGTSEWMVILSTALVFVGVGVALQTAAAMLLAGRLPLGGSRRSVSR